MTSTQETPPPAVPIGQAVGQAEAALTRLLTGILAESGTSYQVWRVRETFGTEGS